MSSLSKLAYRTIEVTTCAFPQELRLPPTHFVLPDIPKVVTTEIRKDFLSRTNPGSRIISIAASRYEKPAALLDAVRCQMSSTSEPHIFLVVGGDKKTISSITTSEAIDMIRRIFPNVVTWCTWDPNSPMNEAELGRKTAAGATGVITQPILTSRGWQNMDAFDSIWKEGVDLIPGIALPKSIRDLRFWFSLLNDPPSKDALFLQHLECFDSPDWGVGKRQSWSMEQRDRLLSYDTVSGLHFMPLGNEEDLLSVFQ